MQFELKPLWRNFFNYNWKFGLFLLLIVCVPRFILVLHANASGNYGAIGLIMVISAITPFIFLTKWGRKEIGIRKTQKFKWLLIAFISGLIASLLLFYLGQGLYGHSYENWYQYIGRSYKIPEGISAKDKNIFFAIVTVTGVTFSPIGEELFFRGIVHGAFAKSSGDKKASIIDSAAFALTHISHFGLVFVNDQWRFFAVPALIWVLGMFLLSRVFFLVKNYSNSIWGAIICHAAFNLGMIYCIFYLL
ncbi:MAG TPA: type II CAAX endopeptidase family protein [Flavitalea sp.]|nr:type II CAAX endopeptidase family protein [Flavitalea sp.]